MSSRFALSVFREVAVSNSRFAGARSDSEIGATRTRFVRPNITQAEAARYATGDEPSLAHGSITNLLISAPSSVKR